MPQSVTAGKRQCKVVKIALKTRLSFENVFNTLLHTRRKEKQPAPMTADYLVLTNCFSRPLALCITMYYRWSSQQTFFSKFKSITISVLNELMSLTRHTFATYLFMSSADDIMQGKGKVLNLTKNKFTSCLLLLSTFQLKYWLV